MAQRCVLHAIQSCDDALLQATHLKQRCTILRYRMVLMLCCTQLAHNLFCPSADYAEVQGDFLPAADVDFYIDMDPTSGEEMVTVEEAKQIRRQGALPFLLAMTAMRHPFLSCRTLQS